MTATRTDTIAPVPVTTSAPAPAITVQGLTKRYGDETAVDDLTFSVPRGTIAGFLGPNGAGKTTTFRMLVGLAEPTAGTAHILGGPYRAVADPTHRVGAMLEISGFHPSRTARNHLRLLAVTAGIDWHRVDELLHLVDLERAADRAVGGFSSGMRQRLGLAAALLGDPDVLLLDEPANGLDPQGIRWLRDFLRNLAHDQGKTLFVSSHVLAEVAQMVDEVVIINRGRLITQGSIDEITTHTGVTVSVRSPAPDRLAEVLADHGATVTSPEPGRLLVSDLSIEATGDLAAKAGITLHELRADARSLEDTFLALTDSEATS